MKCMNRQMCGSFEGTFTPIASNLFNRNPGALSFLSAELWRQVPFKASKAAPVAP